MKYTLITLTIAILLYLTTRALMKKTLYSFWNVVLWALILFFSVSFVEQMGIALFEIITEGDLSLITREELLFDASMTSNHLILFVISVMCIFLIISNVSLMKHEGKRLTNLYGAILGISFLIATELLHLLSDSGYCSEMVPYLFILLYYAECITGGIMIMGYIASRQVPKYDKDFIIILGCSISKNGGLLPLLKQRTNRAIRYAWEQEMASGKQLMYVPSGGQGEDEIMSEGSAMALYLESHGAEPYEVHPEKKSANTYENFLYSKSIIDELKPEAKTAFATTNYHVFRSGMLARKVGYEDIEAISSKTKWYFWPNGFAREIIGIFAMTWKWHAVSAILLISALYISNII